MSSEYEQSPEYCEDDKHYWVHNSFCDRCDKDFDDWLNEKRKRVAFEILAEDLKQVLDDMWNERKITRDNANHLYFQMLELARERGYI
jgi:hypothetical protein